MQILSYMVSEGARLLCSMRAQELANVPESTRKPTEKEMRLGVPEWFRVQEVRRYSGIRIDKYYFSIDGQKFRSIREVKKWRENLEFEFSDETTNEAPSF